MGGSSSKPTTVAPEPISTTTTTVPTIIPTTVSTPADDVRATEVACRINDREILYMSLAFISGILLTVLVFAIIFLCKRKNYKRSHQTLQEEVFPQMAAEESARNTQNEVTYSTLVFQQSRTALPV